MKTKEGSNFYYWVIVMCCCAMTAASVGLTVNAYGVFYTPVAAALGVGRGTISMHATISGLMIGVVSPFVVKLLKKINIKKLIFLGTILVSVSTLLMAYAHQIWMFNVLGAIRGIGCAFYFIPIVTMILGNWFEKGRGTVTGIVLSFSGLAGAVFSPILSSMIVDYGYQTAYVAVAIVNIILSLPGVLFCELHPEDKGMVPFGAGEAGMLQAAEHKPEVHYENKLNFTSPLFICLGSMGVLAVSITGIAQHLSGFAESIGAQTAVGASMISAVMIGNIVSKFIIGILSDKIGEVRAIAYTMGVTILGLVLLLLGSHITFVLLAASFLFGSIYAVSAVGTATLTRFVYGNEQYGEAYAIISALTCIGSSLALTIVGVAYDVTGTYTVSIVGGILFGLATIALLAVITKISGKGAEGNH